MSIITIIRSALAIVATLTELYRNRTLREEGKKAAFLEIYKAQYERLKVADEIRARKKSSDERDISKRL